MSSDFRVNGPQIRSRGKAARRLVGLVAIGLAAGIAPGADEIVLRDWLVIDHVGVYARAAIHQDVVEARIVSGQWEAPHDGDTITCPDGETRAWKAVTAGADGRLEHEALGGGYACAVVDSDAEEVWLLDAAGHSLVYVNGEPRVGDLYQTGWTLVPVLLRRGPNTLLFPCSRGALKAKLTRPAGSVLFNPRDPTVPDLLVGESGPVLGAIPVLNAGTATLEDVMIEASVDGGASTSTRVPAIPPLSLRKATFSISRPAPTEPGAVEVKLRLRRQAGVEEPLDTAVIRLNVRTRAERYKRTFTSDIDGSTQYYAVTPAHPEPGDTERPALFLTLHGAGVEASNQAAAYGHKTWGHVVAPTNRRPYGFDWEDWGRQDAWEVLQIARTTLGTDPARTYLLGHSMGGHGVWQVGAMLPDQFAALAPSAGWTSFESYTGTGRHEPNNPVAVLVERASSPSNTLAFERNYLQHGVYILHGSADDNVPVDQARMMRAELGGFHADFAYYERPGAGHWWGSECVDWPPLFDFLRHHRRPETRAVRELEYVTASPGVSASCHWATIEAQTHALQPSSVILKLDATQREFAGTTVNVARLSIDLSELSASGPATSTTPSGPTAQLPPGQPIDFDLDGQSLSVPWPSDGTRVWLTRTGQSWEESSQPSPLLKGPARYGPFKEAFGRRFVLVYGTHGSAEENVWALARARYDAELFWYRGNGAPEVIPDTVAPSALERDRSVILYGHSDMNAWWREMLASSPVQVRRGLVAAGAQEWHGDDLGCLVVRPRPGSDVALVGSIAGSGLAGLRVTDRLPYFLSGAGLPDCLVLGADVLTHGVAGVRLAGFFGGDWGMESGDFAWSSSGEK